MLRREKPVRSCICYPNTFAELKDEATRQGWTTIEEITAARGCGSGCGACRPYLQKMLETGETAFEVMVPQEVKAFLRRGEHLHNK